MINRSIQINSDIIAASASVVELADDLYQTLPFERREYAGRKQTSDTVLVNLVRGGCLDKSISYSRSKRSGDHGDQRVRNVIDALRKTGLVEHCMGSKREGLQSEVWATGDLLARIKALKPARLVPRADGQIASGNLAWHPKNQGSGDHDFVTTIHPYLNLPIGGEDLRRDRNPDDLAVAIVDSAPQRYERLWRRRPRPSVILKDRRKQAVPFEETALTISMAFSLGRYNETVQSAEVVYVGRDLVPTVLDSTLYRVFNRTWDFGGRFYGGDHQGLSEDERTFILIDRQPTVEIDYSALHPRMLYHLGGMDYRDDPYLAFVESPNERPIAKLLLTCSLNTGSEERAIEAARNELDRAKAYHERHPDQPDRLILPEGKSLRGLMDRMRAVHRPILSRLFVPRTGVELQRLDSEIACDILEHCTACGIVCLPIHDSFLVPRRHATELREAMEFFYQERLGHAPVCH